MGNNNTINGDKTAVCAKVGCPGPTESLHQSYKGETGNTLLISLGKTINKHISKNPQLFL